MEDMLVRFKILFDVLLSIEDGPDVDTILLRTLRVLMRKSGCAAGAVFRPLPEDENSPFQLTVSVPRQIRKSQIFGEAAELVTKLSGPAMLYEQDAPPICRRVGDRGSFYVFVLPGVGLLVLIKIGTELSHELVRSLAPVVKRLAETCLARQARAWLEESNERFQALVENADDSILVFDQSGGVVDANGQAQARFDRSLEQLHGLTGVDLGLVVPQHSWLDLFASGDDGTQRTWEQELTDGRGNTFEAELRLGFYRIQGRRRALVWLKDISERRELERERLKNTEERERAKRLESLGLMTSSIAHDFNNMLVAILGHTELALLETGPTNRVAQRLHHVESAARNLAAMTKQLLAFSGGGRFTLRPLDLTGLTREIVEILDVSVPQHVKVVLHNGAAPSTVMADSSQMEQLVMNLLSNAVEAYGEQGGVVDIAVQTAQLDSDTIRTRELSLESGPFVILRISDQACGMTTEQVSQIFEPFFTTKLGGRGLGLAAAQGIARGHNGAIAVDSKPGQGTTFEVFIPVCSEALEQAVPPDDTDNTTGPQGTILLVDDQPEVLAVAKLLLEELGYEVVAASSGREALSLFELHQHTISVAVIDLTMPEMDGIQICDALRAMRPALPVILSSGYSADDVTRKLRDRTAANFIQKPYSLGQLRQALSSIGFHS
jgi:PAS domain S-box-containing protein